MISPVVELSGWDGTDEALVELFSYISHDFLSELIFRIVVAFLSSALFILSISQFPVGFRLRHS